VQIKTKNGYGAGAARPIPCRLRNPHPNSRIGGDTRLGKLVGVIIPIQVRQDFDCPLGILFSYLESYRPAVLESREQLQQLGENATKSLHGWASLGRICLAKTEFNPSEAQRPTLFFRDPDVDTISAEASSNASAAVPKYAIS